VVTLADAQGIVGRVANPVIVVYSEMAIIHLMK